MVSGKEMDSVGKSILCAMSKTVGRLALNNAGMQKMSEVTVKGNLSKANNNTDAGQSMNFIGQMSGTVANLLGQRFVAGRSTADDGGYPGMTESETVFARDAHRLAGESQIVQDGIHKSPRAISGKGSAGSVGAMGSGCQAKDKNTGTSVSKAGNGTRPVGLILIGTTLGFADSAAIIAKSGTAAALDDRIVDLLQDWRKRLNFRATHYIP